MIRKIALFIFCYFFGLQVGITQDLKNVGTYIKERVKALDNLPKSSFSEQSFEAAWVDGIDIRTETDEFKFNRQRYLIRVSPNTPKIRKAQDNLHQLYLKQADLNYGLLKKDFIEIAYREVLQFYETYHQLLIKQELLVVLQDQEKVWQKLNQAEGSIAKDWMDLQKDIAQLTIEIYKEEEQLKLWEINGRTISLRNFLSPERILEKLPETSSQLFHFQAKTYDIENLIIEREEELEKAEQKKLLDFVQLEYNGPHSNELNERVSLTAGFRLPFSSSRKLKMEEIAIEKEVLQQERLAEKQVDQYKEKEQRMEIDLLLKELIFTKEQMAKGQELLEKVAERNSEQAGGNPLFLLYQKENRLKQKQDILDLEMEIYKEYVDFLVLTEKLYQEPFHNYLSGNK